MDRGANGGVLGKNARVISIDEFRKVDIVGVNKHQIPDINLGTGGGVVDTNQGAVIAIMNNYAIMGTGQTVHSSGQLEFYHNEVCDKSVKVGGKQCVITLEKYVIPITIRDGLPRIKMRPFTDEEWDTLPHVIITDPSPWDPRVLDYEHDTTVWYDTFQDMDKMETRFDDQGNYLGRVMTHTTTLAHRMTQLYPLLRVQ